MVGGYATVGRLSNNVFWTFQAIWENFEKSRWTVTRQWLRSRDRRPTVKQRFRTFQAIFKIFWKSRWTVTRQWSEVTRPSADCQTTFFGRFKRFGKILKKVAERSRDSGRRSRDRWLTVKQRFWTYQAIGKLFVKTHRRVTRQWSVVTGLSADCQAHICMYIIINESERERDSESAREREKEREKERKREREREREREKESESERERERPNTKIRQKKLPRQFSRLLTPVPSLSVFHGNLPQEICGASSPMFIMGEIEREREREWERESERERPNATLHLDGESLTKRQKSGEKIYPTIFPFVDSCPISLGFSWESPA